MDKTSPLDTLTIVGLGRKMEKLKIMANQLIEEGDDSQHQCGIDILDIVDPHRHKLEDKKKVLDLLDFKEHLNNKENG